MPMLRQADCRTLMSNAAPFVLFRDDLAGGDLLFEAPSALIEAHDADDFAAALDQAEAARSAMANGWPAISPMKPAICSSRSSGRCSRKGAGRR